MTSWNDGDDDGPGEGQGHFPGRELGTQRKDVCQQHSHWLSPDSVLTWPGRVSEDRSSPPRLAQSLRFGPETPGLGCCRQVAICGVLASPRWENGLLQRVLGPLHRHKDTSASRVGGHTLGLSGYEHLSPSELSQQVGWPENGAEPLGHGPSSPQKRPNPH